MFCDLFRALVSKEGDVGAISADYLPSAVLPMQLFKWSSWDVCKLGLCVETTGRFRNQLAAMVGICIFYELWLIHDLHEIAGKFRDEKVIDFNGFSGRENLLHASCSLLHCPGQESALKKGHNRYLSCKNLRKIGEEKNQRTW